ncbi:hypothetical protein GR168_02650 [Gordonia sp. JH63]|uniref:hypothetical protein n=1 Tax=Gordonia sp. JH63 TaxID=2698900 RepID=UPI0013200ED9|nr:hypothetical protein [Gordonia sp. JH63]QHD84413.1 hypothetical protein GR168_02650 [Gordonia sp. JH63]
MDHATFDNMSAHCEFYTGRAWNGTLDHLVAANSRQAEAVDILNAHADWLSATKQRVEASGARWNTISARRQSRLDGDLAEVPEWIGEMSERLTPEWLLNR